MAVRLESFRFIAADPVDRIMAMSAPTFRAVGVSRLPAIKGRRGPCKVCAHPEVARIELLLASGAGQNATARKFNLSKDSVFRHWNGHVSAERKAALIAGPAALQSLGAKIGEEAESVLDLHKAVRAPLWAAYAAAAEVGDAVTLDRISGRLTDSINATGRLTGELASSPLVQNNVQINLIANPEFARFQSDLLRVLSKYPEAARAVMAEFQRLDGPPSMARPALEHGK